MNISDLDRKRIVKHVGKWYKFPCKCEKCGNIFLTSEALPYDFYINAKPFMLKMAVPCPRCKHTNNRINFNLFHSIQDLIDSFDNVQLDKLIALQLTLKSKLTESFSLADFENAQQDIINTVPQFNKIKNPSIFNLDHLFQFLQLVVAVAAVYIAYLALKSPEQKPNIENVTNNYNNYYNTLPKPNSKDIKALKPKKIRYVDNLCSCKSGKKFRNCHGKKS